MRGFLTNPSLSYEVMNYLLMQVFVIIFKSTRATAKLRDLKTYLAEFTWIYFIESLLP